MKSIIKLVHVGVIVLAAVTMSSAIAAPGQAGGSAAKPPHISLQQARTIALKTFPGKIIKEELEHEKGGSGLRYSFDIRQGKRVHEVGVDAETARILENSDDSNDND